MTEAELIEYVSEHFVYELLMLRYSKYHLEICRDQLLWNTMFAAFNVSARNIYDFLSGGGDNRSVRLKDFKGRGASCFESNGIAPTVDRLNSQCLHLGKRRPTTSDRKVTLDRIRQVFEWAESNMLTFIQSLGFKDEIDLSRADLERVKVPALMLKPPDESSATNLPISVTTLCVATTFYAPTDEKS
jgi:hypothetical protein